MCISTYIQRQTASMLVMLTLAALLAACGNTTATSAPAVAPTTAPAAKPAPPPTEVPAQPVSNQPLGLAAQGKILFEETKGCANCHGIDARGTEAVGAPDIQGKTEAQVRTALAGVQMMSHLKLTTEELKAIVAHLKKLSESDH